MYRNNDGFFFFSPFLKEKLVYGGFGALLSLAVLRLIFIRGEGYAEPPYSCLNKSKKEEEEVGLVMYLGSFCNDFRAAK